MSLRYVILIGLMCGVGFAQTARDSLWEHGADDAESDGLPEAHRVMRAVRGQLPPMPLNLHGFIRTRERRVQQDRILLTELRFGDPVPMARYTLSDAFGDPVVRVQVRWPDGKAEYAQWDANGAPLPVPSPSDEVADTGLTWSDLSLDFLWWPDAELLGREQVKSRQAYILLLDAPPERKDVHRVKVWVDERALFIVRAELMNEKGEVLKRIEVDSIKQVREDLWMVKDLIIRDFIHNRRIGIRFEDVIEVDGEAEADVPEEP
ncbi:MAG: outer membrane lipoprotein-sorting protein [Kiritimatiellia bacterium]